MANRRFGGPGPKPNNYAPQGYQGGNKMSPWQGGNAPGNAGLLSSFAGPQAQLALALSSLLQSSNPPPSLLSLNTHGSSSYQGGGGGGGGGFGNQGRFDRGRDFRRPEPYKNNNRFGGGGPSWRDQSTRPLGGPPHRIGGPHPGGGGGRPMNNAHKGGKFINRDKNYQGGKFNKGGNRQNDSVKKEKKEADNSEVSLDESRDEDSSKKRDWKSEKKAEEVAEKAESVDLTLDEDESKENADDKKQRDKSGRYKGVPASLLHCFVCSKSMWDGESFQNHLKGKAHKQMIDSLGQSFQVTVNILRENMRLVEEKKMIEYERMSRSSRYRGGRKDNEPKSHCNMCDLEFFGKIVAHRKNEGHQRLKRFLHPNCDHCAQEFPSRMEWLDHRLTPDHLRKVKEVLDAREDKEDGAPIEEEPVEMDKEPILEESVQAEADDPVLELTDDLHDLHNRIPAHKPNRPVGKANMRPESGFYCDICVRFMVNESLAEAHLGSERHHLNFVESVKRKYKEAKEENERQNKRRLEDEATSENAKKIKTEEVEEAAEENGSQDADKYDPEEPSQDDSALDNATLEEEMAEVDSLMQSANEAAESVKEETPADTASPRARRSAAPPAANVGAVKNGAGPKSRAKRGK